MESTNSQKYDKMYKTIFSSLCRLERKASNHSSESGLSDMQFLDDSPSQSPAHRLGINFAIVGLKVVVRPKI